LQGGGFKEEQGSMEVLKVEKITKSFRADMSLVSRKVLHGVSFHAETGEILGFLGPNGAGKTTTIKIILGLVKPDSGKVRIFGEAAGDKSAMRRVGYLPENPYLYPHLRLSEFLEFCAGLSDIPKRRIPGRTREIISMVGLNDHSGRRLKTFSKGMLQRAGLAQAILHDPDLLILDEPFSGLDPLGRKKVRDILMDLRRNGKTIFFSSHILPDMESLCDRTTIIRDGVVTKSVGLGEILRIGKGDIEIKARGCTGDTLEPLKPLIDSADISGPEAFIVVKKQDFVRTVVQHLYNSGAEVTGMAARQPSLEEAFIVEVTGRPQRREQRDEEHMIGQMTGGRKR
jgi:ABC-2 type transport system ATP-binding protein